MSNDDDFTKMMEMGFAFSSINRGDPGTIPSVVHLKDANAGAAEMLSCVIEGHDHEEEITSGHGCPMLIFQLEDLTHESHTLMMLITEAQAVGNLVNSLLNLVLTEENKIKLFEVINDMVEQQQFDHELPKTMNDHREVIYGDQDPFEEVDS